MRHPRSEVIGQMRVPDALDLLKLVAASMRAGTGAMRIIISLPIG